MKIWGGTAGAYSTIQTTTSNLHMDSPVSGKMYLNYYSNTEVILGGKLTVNAGAGNSEVLKLVAFDTVGSNYIQFYENNGTTGKGYFGYGGGSTDNMQMWNAENAPLQFATNNIERFIISAAGDATFNSNLNIDGGTAFFNSASIFVSGNSGTNLISIGAGGGTLNINSSTATFNKPVQLGSAQSRDKLRVWSDGLYIIGMKSGYSYGHLGGAAAGTDYAMSFQMNNSADRGFWWGSNSHTDLQGAMSLTTTGKLTVAYSVSIGEGESINNMSTSNAYRLFVNGDTAIVGTLYVSSNIIGYSSALSDRKFKRDFNSINAIDILSRTNGYSFNWLDGRHDYGFIADEVEREFKTDIVGGMEHFGHRDYSTVRYEGYVPILVEGWKNHELRLTELKSKEEEQDDKILKQQEEIKELRYELSKKR
jgi:hypothetical protein